jgi:serine/threonine-protein kinase
MTEKLGRYHLLHLLATGGMGEVFIARHEGPGGFAKTVVVKRILRHLAQDQGFIDAFVNEARLAAQLQHPNIAQVFGLEYEAPHWFISMEFVHGRSLRDVLETAKRRGVRIPPAIAVRLASQALQALQFAHELTDVRGRALGILHRDVSPENLLVSFSGMVKLVDFGIARAMTGAVARVGRPRGKLAYMAPESTVADGEVDRRADVYGVGVVLAEMLTLALPSNVPASVDDLQRPRTGWVDDRSLDGTLNAILAKAMAPTPGARFDSALSMGEALESWLQATSGSVQPAEVAAWLASIYGQAVVDANPAVVPLDSSGASGIMKAFAPREGGPGTAALGGATDSFVGPSQVVPAPTVAVPRRQLIPLIFIGAATAVVMVFVTVLAIWPKPEPVVVTVPIPAPTPAPLVPTPLPRPTPVPVPVPAVDDAKVVVKHPPPVLPRRAKTGKVALRVNPWAEVWLGARKLGVTPLEPVELPVGPVIFTLKNSQLGVTKKVSVKVIAGQTTVLKADLFQK